MPLLSPKSFRSKNDKIWVGFSSENYESINLLVVDSIKYSGQVTVNRRYLNACIESYNAMVENEEEKNDQFP